MAETAIKLLLVDDEADFRQALARRLDRRGFAVEEASPFDYPTKPWPDCSYQKEGRCY